VNDVISAKPGILDINAMAARSQRMISRLECLGARAACGCKRKRTGSTKRLCASTVHAPSVPLQLALSKGKAKLRKNFHISAFASITHVPCPITSG